MKNDLTNTYIVNLRSDAAIALASEMVEHAAFYTQGRDFYLEEGVLVDELVQKGMIKSTHDDWSFFCLTKTAKSIFKATIKIKYASHLHQYIRNVGATSAEATAFELCALLGHKGWSDETTTISGANIESYKRKNEKTWWRHPTRAVSKNYLRVLLQAKTFFKQGLPEIYHFQPESCHICFYQGFI